MYRNARKIVVRAVTIAFSIVVAQICRGQETAQVAKESGGMGYSMFGSGTIGINDVNAKFESKGYSMMSDDFFSVGGGGHAIINNRWIIGGEGHNLLGDAATSGNFKTSMNLTYVFFDMGYIVYSIKDLRIYPLIGLGVGGMNLKITEDVTSLSFDEMLDDPQRGSEMSTSGLVLNVACGIDYLLSFGADETGRGGLLFGIRAGYTLSPFKGSWMMDDLEISGAPEIGMTGPYIRFLFGGGAMGKKD